MVNFFSSSNVHKLCWGHKGQLLKIEFVTQFGTLESSNVSLFYMWPIKDSLARTYELVSFLASLYGPIQENIFLTLLVSWGPLQENVSSLTTFSPDFSSTPGKLGRQSCGVTCLLINVSGGTNDLHRGGTAAAAGVSRFRFY